MSILYERDTGNFSSGNLPAGVIGQMSHRRLIALLEESGEIKPRERITHLEFNGNLLRYRVENRQPG